MKNFRIEITGTTPMLMHADDIEWADRMTAWKDDAANRKMSKAGDDRTPAWRWLGSCYRSDGQDSTVSLPADNLMRCFMEAGAMVPVPGGRGNKTFKAQTQSGMRVDGTEWPLLVDGQPLPWAPIEALMKSDDFAEHKAKCAQMGFSLFIKRAKIGAAKHIRVRPRFDRWSTIGTISVWDKQITGPILQEIATFAGNYKGLCDWRPGSKTPGPYGMFTASVTEI